MGRRTVSGVLFFTLTLLVFVGCAHQGIEKGLDEKLAAEPATETQGELQTEAKQLIEGMPGLSPEQRSELSSLRSTTRAQMDEMRQGSLKLRSVLIKDLASPKYDDAEVELIKDRMKDLESRRLSLLFGAVEKANQILGHLTAENKWVGHELVEMYGGHHM